jgi:hypothetical protein
MGARKTKTESGSGLRNAGKRGKANTLPNGWSVSFLKDETTKAYFIEITFPTRGRESDSIQIGAEERA